MAMSAGMTPRIAGNLAVRGLVGDDLDIAEARSAAGIAARNALSAIARSVGGLHYVERCLRLSVFVACADNFEDISAVAEGATAAIAEHIGSEVLPVRSAIGVRALPSGAPVEIELTAAVAEQQPS